MSTALAKTRREKYNGIIFFEKLEVISGFYD